MVDNLRLPVVADSGSRVALDSRMATRPAVVLLSGGLDSTTTLAIAAAKGFTVHALTVRYGQRHAAELDAARRVARAWAVTEHKIVDLDLRTFSGSALTGDLPLPKDRSDAEIGRGIPSTYVPARNTIFLSLALAWAEVLGAHDIFIGVNALDYSGYPDCRPEFIAGFQDLARLATKAGAEGRDLTVHAPLQYLGKAEIVSEAVRLGLDPGQSWSCYDPAVDGSACGLCDSCRLRREGFAKAGVTDSTRYAAG
jgi:7-cyano-7-deazaguanine synthase